jgi:hypothetical protein
MRADAIAPTARTQSHRSMSPSDSESSHPSVSQSSWMSKGSQGSDRPNMKPDNFDSYPATMKFDIPKQLMGLCIGKSGQNVGEMKNYAQTLGGTLYVDQSTVQSKGFGTMYIGGPDQETCKIVKKTCQERLSRNLGFANARCEERGQKPTVVPGSGMDMAYETGYQAAGKERADGKSGWGQDTGGYGNFGKSGYNGGFQSRDKGGYGGYGNNKGGYGGYGGGGYGGGGYGGKGNKWNTKGAWESDNGSKGHQNNGGSFGADAIANILADMSAGGVPRGGNSTSYEEQESYNNESFNYDLNDVLGSASSRQDDAYSFILNSLSLDSNANRPHVRMGIDTAINSFDKDAVNSMARDNNEGRRSLLSRVFGVEGSSGPAPWKEGMF